MDALPHVADVRHRFVTVRGGRLHVAETGADTKPAVVLLHGFPQHWYAWRYVLTALAPDHHVIAVDLPGFGWSDPARHGYSTTERARTVVALLDALGIDTADLVGHDWGAWLAFRVALDAPGRVRRLVSISELHPWPLQRRLLPNVWRMWVTALFELPGLGTLAQRRRGLIGWFLRRDARRPAVWTDDLVEVYARPTARTAAAGQRMHAAFVVRDIARLVLRRDHRRRFETPALVLTGDHDRYIPPSLIDIPADRADAVRTRVISGGHFILDENPEAVTSAIREALSQVGRPPGLWASTGTTSTTSFTSYAR
ncbi:alpha/beta hydrolase [Asanoa sp. NPDC049573]|uniref:alpha/beta fold hydrolase n=1 Tax=Asanoa sp. NPDC049573 TaxID=3155396 RepID=UPI00341FA609